MEPSDLDLRRVKILERKRQYYADHRDEVLGKRHAALEQRRQRSYANRVHLREQARRYYAEHREQILDKRRRDYSKHQEDERERKKRFHRDHTTHEHERQRRYHWKHRDEILARPRRNRREHPERQKAVKARYMAKHGTEERARERERHRLNPERNRTIWNRYRRSHPEETAHHSAQRRARKVAVGGSHTLTEWQQKKELYGHRCVYCGRKMNKLTRDHVVPFALGGSDAIGNIVPACMSCNVRKNKRPLEVFLPLMNGQLRLLF